MATYHTIDPTPTDGGVFNHHATTHTWCAVDNDRIVLVFQQQNPGALYAQVITFSGNSTPIFGEAYKIVGSALLSGANVMHMRPRLKQIPGTTKFVLGFNASNTGNSLYRTSNITNDAIIRLITFEVNVSNEIDLCNYDHLSSPTQFNHWDFAPINDLTSPGDTRWVFVGTSGSYGWTYRMTPFGVNKTTGQLDGTYFNTNQPYHFSGASIIGQYGTLKMSNDPITGQAIVQLSNGSKPLKVMALNPNIWPELSNNPFDNAYADTTGQNTINYLNSMGNAHNLLNMGQKFWVGSYGTSLQTQELGTNINSNSYSNGTSGSPNLGWQGTTTHMLRMDSEHVLFLAPPIGSRYSGNEFTVLRFGVGESPAYVIKNQNNPIKMGYTEVINDGWTGPQATTGYGSTVYTSVEGGNNAMPRNDVMMLDTTYNIVRVIGVFTNVATDERVLGVRFIQP